MGSFAVLTCIAAVAMYTVTVSEAQPPYSLAYNYFDQMAQSYCAASNKAWTFAIRRDCPKAPICNDLCESAKPAILKFISLSRKSVVCYDAFHIKKEHYYLDPNSAFPQPQQGQPIMGTYGYGRGGCTWNTTYCGPNYCCCRAY